ncbi:MAG TPA: PH domain-containing protein [Candidatus Saccharimonadales bacterium]|nr:PH domain-containing protein [Candidatus Saccharimonadales bacterium]
MVSQESIAAQLKRIGFGQQAWGRAEVRELPNIILPDEEIFECVNGIYEGGFALLVATDVRVLLIDKKPLNYLTVEDLRFDMINEIDYNHRAFGAYVDISTGSRELKFRSYNQQRLRKLISHVQRCMAEIKKKQASHQEGQNQHLEQINEHLQAYLLAQYRHQEELQRRLNEAQRGDGVAASNPPQPPRPSPELSDFLLARGLLEQYKEQTGQDLRAELYDAGRREVFGQQKEEDVDSDEPAHAAHPFDINPLRIAYAKLPLALRNRKFGRPSLHAHSEAAAATD